MLRTSESRLRPSAPSSAPGGEIHIEQQDVKRAFAHQLRQQRRVTRSLNRSEMALQQQSGREQDVLLVVDNQNARRVEFRGHVFENVQVSGQLYASGHSNASPIALTH